MAVVTVREPEAQEEMEVQEGMEMVRVPVAGGVLMVPTALIHQQLMEVLTRPMVVRVEQPVDTMAAAAALVVAAETGKAVVALPAAAAVITAVEAEMMTMVPVAAVVLM